MSADRPTGTVVLLFTDVEGSTRRWEAYREAMGEAMRRHDATMQAAIESRSGYVFKTIGDAFCAAFARVDDALGAALEAQRALAAADFNAVDGIRVRMALHAGVCEERDGDYFGPAVNRVARLLSVGHGGQVLLSATAAELAQGHLPSDATLADMGVHQLKDLSQPERVSSLLAPGLRGDAPPLRSLSTMANNLPQHLAPIIGRERDVAEIEAVLRESRVVTIAGAGGIGKTRVALQVAAEVLDDFEDGVWFADLAPIADPQLAVNVVAAAAGVSLPADQDPLSALATTLKNLHALIVLDNCEHVMRASAELAERLVRTCPNVSILATTREPLGISAESVYRLDTLDEASAVALFVARAQGSDRHFTLDAADVPVVADICRRLDGIALAIELAAARVRLLPPKALLGKLNERFRLLTGGSRTALPRQQTMRALVDWSFGLLSEEERIVFRRLGACAGGFTLEAAGEIAAGEGIESWDVLDRLSALVDKSMVVAAGEDRRRYRMLESIRQYALDRLEESGEAESVRAAHAAYFERLSDDAATGIGTGSEIEWMTTYEPDLDNFRAAIDWTVRNDAVAAGRIAWNLTRCWSYFGLDAEGLRYSESALMALREHAGSIEAFPVWLSIAIHLRTMGATRRSLEAGERALAIAEASGDADKIAEARATTGWPRYVLGDTKRAVGELEDAVELYRRRNHSMHLARALMNLAAATADPTLRRSLLEEAVAAGRASGWERATLTADSNLAEEDCENGDVASAIVRSQRILDVYRKRRSPLDITNTLSNLACYLAIAQRYDDARDAAGEALKLAVAYEWRHFIAFTIQTIALADATVGNAEVAAKLLGFVNVVLESLEAERETTEAHVYELLIAKLRERDPETIERAMTAGRAMTDGQAASLALQN